MNNIYDIAIIGGGHAGVEAAWIAAQFPLRVLILSMPGIGLASAPCNPAVGGVGKGQVVKEIDALGGLMGRLADLSGIQYRTLNESKGFAVQSTRVQVDKVAYSQNAEKEISKVQNIDVVKAIVKKIDKNNEQYLIGCDSGEYLARAVIVTTGTFLNGRMHTGSDISTGGRVGCAAGPALEGLISLKKLFRARFKTGTPPRLKSSTIRFDQLEIQPSDSLTRNFHLGNSHFERSLEQKDCFFTRTNKTTHNKIEENKSLSPLFNGQISGVGPRYCPSIEDKVFRYPERHEHHVFLEPESHELDTIYPNGISTSLPKEIQLDVVRSIEGLEDVEIETYGYAVEYDVVDTLQLNHYLEHKEVHGLYFAGQINGTSGYEEAAAQGLVAGLNAALGVLDRQKIVFDRQNSYIGLLVDDLVTTTRDEPYRLFTARSDNRLWIREDNAFIRLYNTRRSLGLKSDFDQMLEEKYFSYKVLGQMLETKFTKTSNQLVDKLKDPAINPVKYLSDHLEEKGILFDRDAIRAVAIQVKYEGYIKRAEQEIFKHLKLDSKQMDFSQVCKSLPISNECKSRIDQVRPLNFGQLRKIEGLRPSTIALVASQIS